MFCPKCGSQNADGTKFCRGCGADVSNVLAVVDGKPTALPALAEKHIELYASGLRGLIVGIGFFLVAGLAFAMSMRFAVLGIFALFFASFFLGTGIARLFQARALRRLREPDAEEPHPSLPSGEPDYIKPSRSIYETDDLVETPRSVTEHTTTHLKMDE